MKGKTPHAPFRWTITQAVIELRVTANKLKTGLRHLGISPGKDGRFSSKEIFDALNNLTPLERKAKEAALQSKIDEAHYKFLLRKEVQDCLIDADVVADSIADVYATVASTIRHCSCPTEEKRFMLDQIRSAAMRERPSSKSRQYQQIKTNRQLRRQQEQEERQQKFQEAEEQLTDGQSATA
jgi:hypothetical protein